MAHTDGLLQLRFARNAQGRSYLASRAQRFPLQLTAPLYLDKTLPGMAFVYVQNPTGGLFGGDHLTIELVAGTGTEVHLTSTAATKVYRTESADGREDVKLAVEGDAYLEYLPEPLIPQAGSRLRQLVTVDLDDGAAFLMADVIGPGRLARGEIFAYDRLERRTVLRRNGIEIAVDAVCLEPVRWPPGKRGVLGSHTHVASLLVIAPHARSSDLADRLQGVVGDLSDVLAGAGSLPGDAGVVVRLLARSMTAASSAVELLWRVVRSSLGKGTPPCKRK